MARAVGRGLVALSCVLAGLVPTITSSAAPENNRWTITPPTMDRAALLTFDPHRLGEPVTTIEAHLDATMPRGGVARVEARGRNADQTWSEWVAVTPGAAADLPVRTTTVQVRLAVGGTERPDVRRIALTAWDNPTLRFAPGPPEGHTFRVFATRVGLVGNTTANGHVIVERDHFVALPSRRGLNSPAGGDYTARICADGGHCAWAPVWDVGPWNIADDYWNTGRAMWQDLPLGTPQAQAAYNDGHNKGKDQFGRKVRNPAGVDLADGTFRDALKLKDNAWVDVTYQWTGEGPWGTVTTTGRTLTVRAAPETAAASTGSAARHAQVRIECAVRGDDVQGSDRWFRLGADQFVPAAHVEVGLAPEDC